MSGYSFSSPTFSHAAYLEASSPKKIIKCGEQSKPNTNWVSKKKSPFTFSRERAHNKSGGTYFRTCSTIIGSKCLTTVFGMGTGVTTLICSPEETTSAYSPDVA